MPADSKSSYYAALQIIQQAVISLIQWSGANFTPPQSSPTSSNEIHALIQKANHITGWTDAEPEALRLVFDRIHLTHKQTQPLYRPAWAIATETNEKTPRIPYTTRDRPDLDALKAAIQAASNQVAQHWTNLSWLTLFVEKFGSHLSLGEPDIALIDLARSTAAIAAALAQQPPDEKLVLIAGDLMGVQNFIYTISSEGALKSLRARSFYLEITTEEIVYRLLEALDLPRTNIIYAGASKFYILAAATESTQPVVQDLQSRFNDWLLKQFQRKVFLAMAIGSPFPVSDLSPTAPLVNTTTPFAHHWGQLNETLSAQGFRKFDRNLNEILEPQPSHEPCQVCHRDDTIDLTPLKKDDPTSANACPVCRQMFALGGRLLNAKGLVRTQTSQAELSIPEDQRNFEFDIGQDTDKVFYQVIDDFKPEKIRSEDALFLINDWELNHYSSDRCIPLFLGNYGQAGEEGFMSASEFAEASTGIKRVGYLRMDVDRLGQIFGRGLGTAHTLPRLTGLSRQMTYFFKVYLNSLAESRFKRLPDGATVLHSSSQRSNLLFIYAGGDDLFVSGSWNDVVDFAFDIYQSFRSYTGNHPDITLSSGISIETAKFPLYQAAAVAGDAEKIAKANDRDSLCLFGEVFKWDHWLGNQKPDSKSRAYLEDEAMPELLGVLPFVQKLLDPNEINIGYPQSFIRNLLVVAQLRQEKIQEIRKTQPCEEQAVTYYLHLPKLAYTLSRLPAQIRTHANFTPIRQSLMSPRNSPYFRAIATWIELLNR
ncbi:type III-A CRISPR-associated protein Cas10/Csm1 [filamentous cyanobacterium CCP2]|nr:type III-A CRISPR-associated protein Cas10/Csm1 [filamentous cyanobacterium CCP2]